MFRSVPGSVAGPSSSCGMAGVSAEGSRFTAGWDINPSGEAVGVYQDASSRFHGFVVDPLWNFTTLDFPGGVATRAFGINARGDVVGSYVDTSNRTHGFLARRIAQDP